MHQIRLIYAALIVFGIACCHCVSGFDWLELELVRSSSKSQNAIGNLTVKFEPLLVEELIEGEEANVYFNFTPCCSANNLAISIVVDDDKVTEITENSTIQITDDMLQDGLGYGSFKVYGKRLGLAELSFYIHDADTEVDEESDELAYEGYRVIVLRERSLRDDIYRYGIITFASIVYFGFGCQINLDTIWKICKKPVAPAIGVSCQFIVMPLLGFGVSKMIGLDDVYAFGLLAMSCSPGGGGSNTWAYLLGGDLDLSITMTFFSTIFSLVFMPFWMWALGRYFIDTSRVEIPYTSIVRTLLTLVIPLLVGVLIRRYTERVANFLIKITKPMTLLFILFLLTYGTWVNWYMYVIMGTVPEVIPAAILLPWFGFALGFLIAKFIARLTKVQSITVGIETGYQNPSIPIVMLQGNFVQPEGDLGAVMPVATAFFTPVPLYFWYIYIEIKKRWFKSDVDAEEGAVEGEEEVKDGTELDNKGFNKDVSEKHDDIKMENGDISKENKNNPNGEVKEDNHPNGSAQTTEL